MRAFFYRELAIFGSAWHTWYFLAFHDVKSKYRRSVLGPFWMTLTSLFFIIGLGFVYSKLLHVDIKEYLPYLACGFIAWTYITSFVNEGANTFINSGHIIKQLNMPFMAHIMRVAFRNLVIFLHSWVILIPLMLWYDSLTISGFLFSIVGILLVTFALIPMATLLSVICVRYRDVAIMVASGMQLLFFVTPVMWQAHQLTEISLVLKLNLFGYLIDLVREPMLTGHFPVISATVVLCTGVALWLAAFFALFLNRKHIPYWV